MPLTFGRRRCALRRWAYHRHRPGQTQASARGPAQKRDWNWAHGRRQPGVCTAGSVRMPAAFSDGGACGVAAVCRRPVKDPPRQFGERAFPGIPWMPAFKSAGLQPGPGRLLKTGLQGPAGAEGSKGSLCRPPVPFNGAGPGGDRNGGLCGDTWGCVCPSAR